MDHRRLHRRTRQQVGLHGPGPQHLDIVQQIASVIALSLQQNQCENVHNGRSRRIGGSKQGCLASTLRVAQQNVSDMTIYLQQQRQDSQRDTIRTRQDQENGTKQKDGIPCDKSTICGICLERNVVHGDKTKEDEFINVFVQWIEDQWTKSVAECLEVRQQLEGK
ncbi:unnamed protein product [Peronospora belbahrii]|uniref:Uncharacterized protein n=1 Tax=Peronospora belbahrii TaxID=622444 RepID=A0AAU9L0M8_9STRA|nr:unnamed protein product [Peronospora belbahrii]CAH0517416.1 unnamed protein product [Peronospora belbahrii]